MIVFMFWCFQNNKKTVLILLRFKMTSRASTVVQTTQCFSPALKEFLWRLEELRKKQNIFLPRLRIDEMQHRTHKRLV